MQGTRISSTKHKSAATLACACLLATVTFTARSQVVISEFLAANKSALPDQDGDYSDWIELYNPTSSAVDLTNWSLTDDAAIPAKWRFPNVTLAPKGFLIVFASGKNRATPGAELHANFSLNASGEYLALVRPDGATIASEFAPAYPQQYDDISYGLAQNVTTNQFLQAGAVAKILVPTDGSLAASWTTSGFNDSSWLSGPTGVGYETAVPGFAVRNFKANVTVGSLDLAKQVINTPSQQTKVSSENSAVLDYLGTGGGGHYANDRPFPGAPVGADVDDFVIEATATVTIPQAGDWTFGVNSDDGFELTIGSFTLSFPNPRAPADSVGVFNAPAAGDYPLRVVFYERGGGSGLELFAAKGRFASWDPQFHLMGDTANGGLNVKSVAVSSNSGVGFGSLIQTDLKAQMNGKNASAYLRLPFTLAAPQAVTALTLRMKYDDGFVAYLNGQEVARRNAPASVQWNSAATSAHPTPSALVFDEINLSDRLSLLQSGANVLTIQGLNVASGDTDFLMLPELLEYQIQASTPHYFATPTPGSPNGTGFIAFVADTKFSQDRGFYDQPFSVAITTATTDAVIRFTTDGTVPTATTGQVYAGPISISTTTTLRAAAFKDGFQPSNVDTQTYIFLSDVIRQSANGQPPPGWPSTWGANVVDYGMDPDVVNDPLYRDTIQSDLKSLPSFSIVLKVSDLFDSATGIYANAAQDGRAWERPCSVELIYPDGTKGFQINAGIRIRGGYSRSTSNPKHAFRLFFRSEYGTPKLRYPLFGDEGTDTFDNIDLRTFQNYSWSYNGDSRGIFVRDQFNRDLQLAMGQPGKRGRFYHLYINGQYWGLFNTDERTEASYGETYFGGIKEDYDVLKVETGPYDVHATDGNMDAWTRLYNLALAGFASNDAYQRVQGRNPDGTRNSAFENLIDVPNLIDYMLIILYGGNLDAPISNFLSNTRPNNWWGVRNRNGLDGFRFFIHDAEHTLLNVNEDRTGPYPSGDTSVVYSNPQWVWQKLQANAEFRLLVADHVHRHFFNSGVLTPASTAALFQKRIDQIDRAVVGESARWGDSKRAVPFTRNVEWVSAVNNIKNNYLPQRSGIVLNQLRADGLYPAVVAPSFNQHGGNVSSGFQLSMSAPAGTIYYTLDGNDPRLMGGAVASAARVYGGPFAITDSVHVKSRVRSGTTWSALNEADFFVIRTFKELLVTELMYHPASDAAVDGDEFEFIELKNAGSVSLDLSGVHFTAGVRFQFPIGTHVAPGEFAILVSNAAEFAKRYPGVRIDGVYTGKLSNGGETVQLVHATGTPIFSVQYNGGAPWPGAADGKGFSLVPVNPNVNPDPNNPANWRASARIGGSPGADDPPTQIAPVWINEILTHTDPPEVDAIELYNPNNSSVDLSFWYLTDDRQTPQKYRLPAGTVISPGAFRVFTETDFNPTPGVDPSFTLSSLGEEVFLYSADAAGNLTGFSDGFTFGAAANGETFGRYTTSDGQVQYPAQSAKTLGALNAGPRIGPVVINEIQYHPALGDEEFVELKNVTQNSVKLYDPQNPANTWQLGGLGFVFPPNQEIGANGLLLLVGSDPSAFRTRHQVPTQVPILGPFAGVLQDSGERLQLMRPDTPNASTNGAVFVPYIVVDEVRYNDKAPWPTEPDGNGPSLEKSNPRAYGNDPGNWRASPGPASPGLDNSGNRPPQVNAGADLASESTTFPVTFAFSGTATDDGSPNPPGALTIAWTQVSGPALATFENPKLPSTRVTIPSVGDYLLRLTASDGDLQTSDDVKVTVTRTPTSLTLIPKAAVWKYLDNGSDQGAAWRSTSFNDAGWKSGAAQLGYGDGDETTVIGFGPDPNNKFTTTYFRRAFSLGSAGNGSKLTLKLLRDDGAVVYLNGLEVARSNMPEDVISFSTPATVAIGGADESTFFEFNLDPSLLVAGNNVVAVEIHQQNGSSSDVSFDLELAGSFVPVNQTPTVNAGANLTVTLPQTASLNATASDDGLPNPPGRLSFAWSMLSGPGVVTLDPSNAAATTATFSTSGTFVLQVTATDGELAARDEITVIVRDAPLAGVKDFNGDGLPDLLFQSNDGFLGAWFMDGVNLKSGSYFSPSRLSDPKWQIVGTGDFNADKQMDLIFQHADGTLAGWMMNGVTLASATLLNPAHPGDANWRVVGSADLNRDGKPDLLYQHTDGTLAVWFMNGVGLARAQLLNPSSPGDPQWRVKGAGDLNQDGQTDLVFQHADGTLGVWFLNETQLTTASLVNPANPGDPAWQVAAVIDLNRDGHPDLVFQHARDRTLAVWFLNGVNLAQGQYLNPSTPAAGWRLVGP